MDEERGKTGKPPQGLGGERGPSAGIAMEVRRIRAAGEVGAPRVAEGLACHAGDFLLRITGRP